MTATRQTFVDVCYTYTRVWPDELDEHGWYHPGGRYYDTSDVTASESVRMSAHELLREINKEVGYVEHAELRPNGCSLTVSGGFITTDYRTGSEESIAAHITGHPRLVRAIYRKLSGR
jgi:hypothetical protein